MKNVNASVQILTLGEASILDLPKVGFLSSRKVPPAAVMKCYDWATEMREKGVCVMGGFQKPLHARALREGRVCGDRSKWCVVSAYR